MPGLRAGIVFEEAPPTDAVAALVPVAKAVVVHGGSVVVARPSTRETTRAWHEALGLAAPVPPTLNYGQALEQAGYHVMAAPTAHLQETIAGLGAAGVDVALVVSGRGVTAGHPFIPVLHLSPAGHPDADLALPESDPPAILNLLLDAAAGRYTPAVQRLGFVDFQMSRGWTGVSL